MNHFRICAIAVLLSSCHLYHTGTSPKTTPRPAAKLTIRARIVVDQGLADQVGNIWAAAQRWNRDLGCQVFTMDLGDASRGNLYVVPMLPWQRTLIINGVSMPALADAIWNFDYGVMRVYDTLEPSLQRHVYRHELGHILGLPDLYDDSDFGNIMFGIAYKGTSRHHTPSYTEATTVSPGTMAQLRKLHCGSGQHGNQDQARRDRVQGAAVN